ncbi:hypothetical protein C8034_v008407 [Colletotrichum sidae]|uniref:Uncharacterized protein n=1 Tax=Colletotrichum sidae TaxID=1347389 RepID=A0A4R8TLH7_9PEZI|nr:hypothetical protein C8034_v008407 [Colletotrichum sidae]
MAVGHSGGRSGMSKKRRAQREETETKTGDEEGVWWVVSGLTGWDWDWDWDWEAAPSGRSIDSPSSSMLNVVCDVSHFVPKSPSPCPFSANEAREPHRLPLNPEGRESET